MIEYKDPFERQTFLEVIPSGERVIFVIRKERQVIYESWDMETAKAILTELQQSIEEK